jgi:hypothetical protein
MNVELQELLDRQRKAMNSILKSPKTLAQVILIFEDFVAALEEIVDDLATRPDEQVAKDIRKIRLLG